MACKVTSTSCGVVFCLLLGAYQIKETVWYYYTEPVGTEVAIVTPSEAFGDHMTILYCTADWMDLDKFENLGLSFRHMWYLTYWLEILSGEHGRLKGKRAESYQVSDPSQVDLARNALPATLRRSLMYLESIDFMSQKAQTAAQEWRFILGSLTNDTIDGSAAWDFTKPKTIEKHAHIFNQAHADLVGIFGTLTSANVRKMFQDLSFNPLTDQNHTELEFRYGQVCYKVKMSTGLSMSAMLKRPMIKRAEVLPEVAEEKKEVLERYTTFPAGIHVSPYVGGLYPVWGGDDDSRFRRHGSIPCISGGYLVRVLPPYVAEPRAKAVRVFDSASKAPPPKEYCQNKCVDAGMEVDSMVAAIKIQTLKDCEAKGTCLVGDWHAVAKDSVCTDGDVAHECAKDLVEALGSTSKQKQIEMLEMQRDKYIAKGGDPTSLNKQILQLSQEPEPEIEINEGAKVCKNPKQLVKDEKHQFGKRIVISVFTLLAKVFKRVSTRTAKCVETVNPDDMLPVYQDKSKCEATCQDEVVHRAFGNCTVSGVIFPDELAEKGQEDVPACGVIQFWENMEHITNETVEDKIKACEKDCGNTPRCLTFQASLERGEQMYVKLNNLSESGQVRSEQPFNFHKIVMTPVDIEVTEEQVLMPWDIFVANLGGLFGFFLGLSMLQVIMWPIDAWNARKKKGTHQEPEPADEK